MPAVERNVPRSIHAHLADCTVWHISNSLRMSLLWLLLLQKLGLLLRLQLWRLL
jgi:hypothetical protein